MNKGKNLFKEKYVDFSINRGVLCFKVRPSKSTHSVQNCEKITFT